MSPPQPTRPAIIGPELWSRPDSTAARNAPRRRPPKRPGLRCCAAPPSNVGGSMRIAVIGAGNIGGTLGGTWAEGGHDVTYGVRSPRAPGTTAVANAVSGARGVVLARPGPAGEGVLAPPRPAPPRQGHNQRT